MAEATVITRGGLDTLLREQGVAAYRLTPSCHKLAGGDLVYGGQGLRLVRCHRCQAHVAALALALAWRRTEDPPC